MSTEKPETTTKPGPIPGPPTRKYNVLIEPDDGEWAKQQPGGLSEFVRSAIKQARRDQFGIRSQITIPVSDRRE